MELSGRSVRPCRDCGRKWPDSLEARGGGGPEQCADWPHCGQTPSGRTCCHRVTRAAERVSEGVSGRRVRGKHRRPGACGLALAGWARGQLWSTDPGAARPFVAMFSAETLCQRRPRLFYNLYGKRKAMLTARRRRVLTFLACLPGQQAGGGLGELPSL